jgi:hypothetical protein
MAAKNLIAALEKRPLQQFTPCLFEMQSFTCRQLKVKPKSANVSGLQLADIIAHPSRAEILDSEGLLGRPLATFSKKVIELLQNKYDRQGERIFGRKFI